MLLGPQSEGVHIDTRVRGAGVVLEGLHHVEVGAFALGEAVLAVELELGRDDGVLAPAVHVEGRLGEHKGAGIGHEGARVGELALCANRGARGIDRGRIKGVVGTVAVRLAGRNTAGDKHGGGG